MRCTNLQRGFDQYNVAGDNYALGTFQAQDMVNDGLAWLEENRKSDHPFFLWLHFLDPHEPYTPDQEFSCLFAGEYCSDIQRQSISFYEKQQKELQGCQLAPLPKKTVAIQQALYDAELYQTDQYVGMLLSYLKEHHLDEDTIVMFYSDHGEGFDHNYYFTHSEALYESSVRIPLIISTPETRGKGKIAQQLVATPQFLSTLLTLLGFGQDIPNGQRSVASIIKDPKLSSQQHDETQYFINQSKSKFAIREGKMKYIFTNMRQGSSCLSREVKELYDLSSDPEEQHNLIDTMPDVALQLHTKLIRYIQASRVQFSDVNERVSASQSAESTHEQNILQNLRDLGY